MAAIIIVELSLLIFSLISTYLTWGPLTSREMVDYFGPQIRTDSKLSDAEMYERRRKAGYSAEALRAIMITVFGLITIPFYASSVSILSVLSSPFFQWAFFTVAILVLVYNLYFGPRFFAIKYCGEFKFNKFYFEKFMRPYWVWLFYPLLIFGGTGLLVFMMIVGGIAVDIERLQAYITQIYNTSIKEVVDVQFALIRLNQFGNFISSISQKYILTSVLTFIYVIVEQRSSMRNTILDSSVERLKYAVWSGMIFTIIFSLMVLPSQYQELHSYIQNRAEALPLGSVYPDHLNDMLAIQQSLADHNLKWLMLQIVTGYGNLLTAAIIGFSVFLWKFFFDDVPVKYIVRLMVPKFVLERFDQFTEGFDVDMDVRKDKSRFTMRVGKATEASEELYTALQRLVPQLGSHKTPPTRDELAALIKSESSTLLVARDTDANNKIIGMLCLIIYHVPTGVRSIVEDLVVDKDTRRRGAGEELLRYAITIAREAGADGVALTSNPQREAANQMYRSLGFELRQTNPYLYKLK
jgi:ribosomal protein S18 acetylase RimI-like enzyme